MEHEKPMSLLLIEDDVAACRTFVELTRARTDITFVGATGNGDEGMRYVKERLPEGVILDLELNWGRGSGLEFLEELNKTDLSFRPIVVVTTRNRSELVSDMLHSSGVEWVFCKKQSGYNPEVVINHLLTMRPFLYAAKRNVPSDLRTLESPEELRTRIMQRIDAEMNFIGISPSFMGTPCLKESIYLLINKDKNESETVFQEVSRKFDNTYNNVIRNMQAAINHTWRHNDIEALEKHYKAFIRSNTGVPSPTEFVYYYADKIRNTL